MNTRHASAPAEGSSQGAHTVRQTITAIGAGRPEWQRVTQELIRNRGAVAGMVLMLAIVVAALAPPLVAPYSPDEQSLVSALQGPSIEHLMGTDEFERDIFSRILYGARISLRMGIMAVAIAGGIGSLLGLFAGYYHGWFDTIALRLVDALLAFPDILLALVVLTILGPSITSVTIGIAVTQIPAFVRVARASTLTVRELDYIVSVQVIGANDIRIMLRHIPPNVVAPLIVLGSVTVGSAILASSSPIPFLAQLDSDADTSRLTEVVSVPSRRSRETDAAARVFGSPTPSWSFPDSCWKLRGKGTAECLDLTC